MNKIRKIKVVHIAHDLDLGGLQRVIVNICRTIDRSIFEISVLCLQDLGCFVPEVEQLGVKVEMIPKTKKSTDYFSFLKVADYLKRIRPDIIHTHNTHAFIDGTIAAILSGVKMTIHTDHARAFPDKWRYMFAERVMSHFAYKVVGVSDHTSNNLIQYEKIPPVKIATIPNGIDPQPYRIFIDKAKKRREIGLPEDGPVLGVAVRLSEQKGITYLLKALPQIIAQHPSVSLVIAGDGELKKDLMHETEQLNIQKHVHFLGTRLDIAELLQLFDLYVLPSLWEGLPMIILEAMAAGCPIIATDVGGVSAAINDGKNGILTEARNVPQLAESILKLIHDNELRESFSKKGIEIFNKKFDSKIAVQSYSQLYSEMYEKIKDK